MIGKEGNAISVVQNEHPEDTVSEESVELVIYADSDEEPYLAYIMELFGEMEYNHYFAVVDAQSGELKEFHSVGESANDYEQGTGEDVNGQMRAFGITEAQSFGKLLTKKYWLLDEERKIGTYPSLHDPVLQNRVYSHDYIHYDPKNDSELYGKVQYTGTDLTAPVNLKVGQQIKIKAGSQDVKINYPKYGIYLIAYLSN